MAVKTEKRHWHLNNIKILKSRDKIHAYKAGGEKFLVYLPT